jgi:hypothetical protein
MSVMVAALNYQVELKITLLSIILLFIGPIFYQWLRNGGACCQP